MRVGAARALPLVIVLGCADRASAPPPLTLCAVPLEVTVAPGVTPVLRWTPACGATYLEVTTPNRQQVLWMVQGDTGKFGPGVRYGEAPPAYRSRLGPFPLTAGQGYLVRVGVMVEEDSFFIFGEGSFTY